MAKLKRERKKRYVLYAQNTTVLSTAKALISKLSSFSRKAKSKMNASTDSLQSVCVDTSTANAMQSPGSSMKKYLSMKDLELTDKSRNASMKKTQYFPVIHLTIPPCSLANANVDLKSTPFSLFKTQIGDNGKGVAKKYATETKEMKNNTSLSNIINTTHSPEPCKIKKRHFFLNKLAFKPLLKPKVLIISPQQC